ncbi:MAG: HNH endonuclease [Spirochaetia bacterium]|jgi:hypothetical protein|nr:HNH endonuclease [Spirochaetia bacterium]
MNASDLVLAEKAGRENGFEYVVERSSHKLVLGSAYHPIRVFISHGENANSWNLCFDSPFLSNELSRNFPDIEEDGNYNIWSLQLLAAFLRRASELARSMPETSISRYQKEIQNALDTEPDIKGTEREALIRQRIGQDIYRQALIDYWGGCCALSGIDIPEILRASHAKAWSECETDAERLDVYNGFLFRADIDALFDRHLITFADEGCLIPSPRLTDYQLRALNLDGKRYITHISPQHLPYLAWHRQRLVK